MNKVKHTIENADTEEALNRIFKEYRDLKEEIRSLNSEINELEVKRNKIERKADRLRNKAKRIRDVDPLDPDVPEVPETCKQCEDGEIVRVAHDTGGGWYFGFECQNCYAVGEEVDEEAQKQFHGWWPGAEHEWLTAEQIEDIGFTVV